MDAELAAEQAYVTRPTRGSRRCARPRNGSARPTPTSGRAAPTRPGSSGTSPGTSPSAGSPTSRSVSLRSCSAASTWSVACAGTSGDSRSRTRPAHAARRRLACAGRGAVLPGHRGRADGRRAPPPPHHPQGPRGHRLSTTRSSTRGGRGRRARGRGRRRAPRRARAQPHRPHGRHRRHDPGRTGRGDPRRRTRCAGGRAEGRAPARPPSRCTAPRTSSTRTAAGSRTRACCSVGPSPVFLRYIEQVLPSLGEQDVQLSTISGLKPRMPYRGNRAARARRAEGRRPHGPASSNGR